MMPATLFVNPMELPTGALLWLLLPLCAAVGIVYKTVRIDNLRRLPVSIGVLVVLMIVGLVALGVGLWLIQDAHLIMP